MPGSNVDYPKLAFDLIDEFDRLSTPTQVIGHMATALSNFGYNAFLIASVPHAPADELKQISLLDGWPQGWTKQYEEQNFFKDDPVAQYGLASVSPFRWSDVHYDRKQAPRSALVMDTASEFGLKEGFGIPIHRSDSLDAVTMAGEKPDFDSRARQAIHLIALYAHSKAIGLIRAASSPSRRILTDGEREVLAWTAAGKSSWEISVILHISESTVIWRIQRASRKLNAVNRTQAVVEAIRAKEIQL
jgi:LuxR family transcriptional regulator, quorum-sensing system regulator BjaR1